MIRQCSKIVNISSLSRYPLRCSVLTGVCSNYHRFAPQTQEIALQHARFSSQQINFNSSKDQLRELIATQDPDAFGGLSPNTNKADHEFEDEGDIQEENFIKNPPKKSQALSTKQYADMIKEHLKNNRLKEAIDVLEVNMKEDGFRPMNYIFNLLIDGCARVGYTKKAFNLFTRMRQRGLRVTGATYTSLFNACANDPYQKDGLEKAVRLREIMLEKGYEPNISNYHSMIKAFGRCGDIETAFQLVDEMLERKIMVTTETFNFLLQACASNKEFGFRHALLVWHKMYQKKLKPDLYSFNLMLRCCRDTELGDLATTEEVVQTILLRNPKEHKKLIENQKFLEPSATEEGAGESIEPHEIAKRSKDGIESEWQLTPNLLAPRPYLGNLVQIKEVIKPEDRLLLIGGLTGFVDLMKQADVRPNVKTYTELLEVIPNTRAVETKLLKIIKESKKTCDVDFFNILIKKRALRQDYEAAREVLDEMIIRTGLEPTIVTYGVLALCCQTRKESWALINEMNKRKIKMNLPILGAMLKQGCCNKDFQYIMDVLYILKQLKLRPNDKIFETLDRFVIGCNYLRKKDNKNVPAHFRSNVKKFKEDLAKWKEEMGIKENETPEERRINKEKPWDQFKEAHPDGFEEDKKARHRRKLYKRIDRIKTKNVLVSEEQ